MVVRFASSNSELSWVVGVKDGQVERGVDVATADVTARGSTSNLLLLLWRRLVADDVQVEGDRAALEQFVALADLA